MKTIASLCAVSVDEDELQKQNFLVLATTSDVDVEFGGSSHVERADSRDVCKGELELRRNFISISISFCCVAIQGQSSLFRFRGARGARFSIPSRSRVARMTS